MFRLWFKTFFGESRFPEDSTAHSTKTRPRPCRKSSTLVMEAEHDASHAHGVHESPWVMIFPLIVLAILSVIGGWVGIPAALGGHNEIEHFLDPVFYLSRLTRRRSRLTRPRAHPRRHLAAHRWPSASSSPSSSTSQARHCR